MACHPGYTRIAKGVVLLSVKGIQAVVSLELWSCQPREEGK